MRIAVVGSGVSGLIAARLLATRHDVNLFEAGSYLGGHANTVDVTIEGERYSVDTGFMVFNNRTYPQFAKLLNRLGVASQPSDMSFSVSCERTGLEYQGSSLAGLFAQRANLLRPNFYRLLGDILRFNKQAIASLGQLDNRLTLRELLRDWKLGDSFREHYLLPMTAAIWSCPTSSVLDFPALFLLEFMHNHGLLQIRDRPQWRTIPGGSRRYVEVLTAGMADRIHLNSAINRITREADQVVLEFHENEQTFDAVVLAIHSDTSLRLLADADMNEHSVLSTFNYQPNQAVLHTDESWLPRREAAWASWNYRIAGIENPQVCVTYDLTRLQRVTSPKRLLVTLNPPRPIQSQHVLREFAYQHPVFSRESIEAQKKWNEINGRHRTYFCGAYWGHGFHEDGLFSGLRVAEKFGLGLEACTAPCIAEASPILAPAL
jgi:predicted NAD/FAD-binding protein